MDPLSCLLSYGLLCSAPVAPPAAEPDVPSVTDDTPGVTPPKGEASRKLALVQTYYDDTADMSADFEQTYVHPVYGTKTTSSGKLRIKKPGKMVWDYTAEDTPDLWVSGQRLWMVERDTKQVLKKDVEASDFAGADKFLFGGRQLLDDFQVRIAGEALIKRYGKAAHTVLELRPAKKNPHYKELLLVVDDATGRVDAFAVLNADGSTNHFVLTGITRNSGLADGQFEFVKPKGFTEISE